MLKAEGQQRISVAGIRDLATPPDLHLPDRSRIIQQRHKAGASLAEHRQVYLVCNACHSAAAVSGTVCVRFLGICFWYLTVDTVIL